jgi:hypothetical protein
MTQLNSSAGTRNPTARDQARDVGEQIADCVLGAGPHGDHEEDRCSRGRRQYVLALIRLCHRSSPVLELVSQNLLVVAC